MPKRASTKNRKGKLSSYLEAASAEFLQGTPCKYPIQAIDQGYRTLDQWCTILGKHRALRDEATAANETRGRPRGKTKQAPNVDERRAYAR